jgi:epsilon-lactone hydrolase
MPSRRHQIAVIVVRAAKLKKYFSSEAGVLKSIEKSRPRDSKRRRVPAYVAKLCTVTTSNSAGFPIVVLTPSATPSGAMVFSHGGAYIGELQTIHWRFCAWVASTLNLAVHVPLYPLAPEHTWRETIPSLTEYCEGLISRQPVVLSGDSAGGGLTLALAQRLVASGHSPTALVLISPWLDATADDEAMHAAAANDPLLSVPGLLVAGAMWAGNDDPARPEVSPLKGELSGLPPTMVLTGTRDLLNVDAHRFAAAATSAGVEVTMVNEPGLLHDFPLFPIPEGKSAREKIRSFITENLRSTS